MNDLQPHQRRVVQEYAELFERTKALGVFFGTKMYNTLDEAEQKRLNKQWQLMQQLGLVLSERIDAFDLHNSNGQSLRDDGLRFVMTLLANGEADESGFTEGVVYALKRRLIEKGIPINNFLYIKDNK